MADEWLKSLPPFPPANQPLDTSLDFAVKTSPDKHAKMLGSAQKTNVPIDVAERNQAEINNLADKQDLLKQLNDTQGLKKAFENPDFAAAARDDVSVLAQTEKLVNSLSPNQRMYAGLGLWPAFLGTILSPKSVGARGMAGAAMATHIEEMPASVLQAISNIDRKLSEKTGLPTFWSDMLDQMAGSMRAFSAKGSDYADWWQQGNRGSNPTTEAIYQGIESSITMLIGTLGSIATGTPAPALTWGFLTQGGQATKQGREAGLNNINALIYGTTQGTAEAAGEMIPTLNIIKHMKMGSPFMKFLMSQVTREVPQELWTQEFQNFHQWAITEPNKTFDDFLKEQPAQVYQTIIATLVQGGLHAGVGAGTAKAIQSLTGLSYPETLGESARANQALKNEAAFQEMDRLAADSKLRDKLPQVYQDHLEAQTENAPNNKVFIDSNEFFQTVKDAGVDLQGVIRQVPSLEDQIAYVSQHGGDFQIPLSEWMTKVAGTDIGQALTEHARFDPNDMSAAEARTWQKDATAKMKKEGEEILAKLDQTDAFVKSAKNVENFVKDQLINAGQSPTVADKNAQLHKAFAVTMSSRYPEVFPTPESVYAQHGLQVQGPLSPELTGQTLDQVVFHGSPYKFSQFDLQKIGKGEGNQAYGYGLYFAEHAKVAKQYMPEKGSLYSVDVPDAQVNKFLDWTKPLSEQPEVAKLLNIEESKLPNRLKMDMTGQQVYSALSRGQTNRGVNSKEEASKYLDSLGIKGIKYLDQGSRQKGTGTSNYVIFDPSILKILDRNGEPVSQGELNQFAGRQSRTADMGSLAEAQRLQRANKSNEYIRHETGWFRGTDGRWRYEITDQDAKLNIPTEWLGDTWNETYKNADEWINRNDWAPHGYKWEKTTKPKISYVVQQLVDEKTGQVVGEGSMRDEALRDASRNLGNDVNGAFVKDARFERKLLAGTILDHPKLFAAYPELAWIPLMRRGGNGATYYEDANIIQIGENVKTEELTSTLLHELQHAIQAKENFARGGSSNTAFTESVKSAVNNLETNISNKIEALEEKYQGKKLKAKADAEIARYALMYDSRERLINYANREKPSGVFRLIRNEMQWIYDPEFKDNKLAQDLQRKFYEIPKRGNKKRNAFIGEMAREAASVLGDTIPKPLMNLYKNDTRTRKGMLNALQREASKSAAALKPLQDLKEEHKKAAAVNEASRFKSPYSIYMALAGEIEARNTQTRQFMTEQQRQQASPEQTADVPSEEAIVIMGGMELQTPRTMWSEQPQKRGKISIPTDFSKAPAVIHLLENADLSTFLHESGHFFFEAMRNVASQPNAPERLYQDMDSLVKFAGAKNLDEWNSWTFEQRRAGHEKVAEAFETYLFEGKAPSVELRSVFQTFRSWLVNVYRNLRSYLSPDKLTPEVREVFDRLLATDDAIAYAERSQGFAPLFKTAEEANATPKEWAEYQKNLSAAHEEAISEVQSRELKDMKWLEGARSRELKKLQSQARAARREVKSQVLEEVQQKPVYRALYLLRHGKFPSTDAEPQNIKLNVQALKDMYGGEIATSKPNVVTPEVDPLMTAIAKLGGLDTKEAEAQGIDPANWKGRAAVTTNQPLIGQRIFTPKGRSFDSMVEALSQYGYLPPNPTINDLLDKIDRSMMGDEQYSNQANFNKIYSEPSDVQWQKLVQKGLTSPKGIAPDDLAPTFGFASGDAMVQALINAPPISQVVNAITDQRMLQEHGDLATPEALDNAAMLAVHNKAHERFLANESRFLNKLINKRSPDMKAVKSAAERLLAPMEIQNIRPAQFEAEERKASKALLEAWKKGDREAAARQAQRQMLNFQLAKQARDIVDNVEKQRKYLKKFDKASIRKNIDPDQLEQIDDLRQSFVLKRESRAAIQKRQTLAQWVESQELDDFEPIIDPDQIDEIKKKNYKQMTVEEMNGLVDAIKNIEHIGRLKKRLLTAKENADFQARMDQARQSIEANANRTVKERGTPTDVVGKAGRWARGWLAIHRKFSSIIREMDANQDGGVMWELLSRPMNEAGDTETEERSKATERMAALFEPIRKKISKGGLPNNIYAQRRVVPGTDISMSYEERIMFAMNWGNEGNRQRLLDGGLAGKRSLTQDDVLNILHSLDKQDWDFVQGVWDYFEEFRPQIAAQEKRLTGVEPQWISPTPIQTQYGTYKGGYFPAKYDAYVSTRSEQFEAMTDIRQMMKGAFNAAATRNSYTKERAKQVQGRPLLLSFNTIQQHINEVTHRLAWQDWVTDANRTLRALDETIRRYYGPEILREMKMTVRDLAEGNAQQQSEMDRLINHIRIGSTITGMGWRFMTAAIQVSGLAQSHYRIGGKALAQGLGIYMKNPIKSSRRASEMSREMRDRERTYMREVNEVLNVARGSKKITAAKASFFTFIYKMQRMVDVPTFFGAYEKAMKDLKAEEATSQAERDKIEKKAIAIADQAVIDSQAGGQLKDLARIQRGGPMMKLWTNFYSYFSATYNLNVEAFRRTNFKNPSQVGMFLADMLVLNVAPVLIEQAIRQLLVPDCEDSECFAKKLAQQQLSYLFGQMIVLRELGEISNYFISGKGYGYSGPPGIRLLGDMYKLGQQTSQGEADLAWFKAANSVAGAIFHYPAGQINTTMDGLTAIQEGRTKGVGGDIRALLFGAPKK